MQKVYLDTCCLNRPFDDQSQVRIRLESEAVLQIIGQCTNGLLSWVASDVLDFEIARISNTERRERVHTLRSFAENTLVSSNSALQRSLEIRAFGIGEMDALHIACAEEAQVDVFLTTDDRLLKSAGRFQSQLNIDVSNPMVWILKKEDK